MTRQPIDQGHGQAEPKPAKRKLEDKFGLETLSI